MSHSTQHTISQLVFSNPHLLELNRNRSNPLPGVTTLLSEAKQEVSGCRDRSGLNSQVQLSYHWPWGSMEEVEFTLALWLSQPGPTAGIWGRTQTPTLWLCVGVCACVCTCVCVCVCVWNRMFCVWKCLHPCVCACVCTCVLVCLYVTVCLLLHTKDTEPRHF